MKLSPNQSAALRPLLDRQKAMEAEILLVCRAYLVSADVDPATWDGHIRKEEDGTISLVFPEQDSDAAP